MEVGHPDEWGLSQVFTGYGVQLWPVALVTLALFLDSAAVYTLWGGVLVGESLYYSIDIHYISATRSLRRRVWTGRDRRRWGRDVCQHWSNHFPQLCTRNP